MEKAKKEKIDVKKLSIKRRIIEITNKLKVKKSGKNTFAKYDYITPEDIMKELNPLLQEYNLITIFNMDKVEENKFLGKLSIEDCDSNARMKYRFLIPFSEVKGASAAQAMGATLTYCKRYSLMNAFNIASDDDLDKVVDGKNVKENKQKQEKKYTVTEVIKMIRNAKDKETLNKWNGWVDMNPNFTEPQKNVALMAIEEEMKKYK